MCLSTFFSVLNGLSQHQLFQYWKNTQFDEAIHWQLSSHLNFKQPYAMRLHYTKIAVHLIQLPPAHIKVIKMFGNTLTF